jgi:hypothetical protein
LLPLLPVKNILHFPSHTEEPFSGWLAPTAGT